MTPAGAGLVAPPPGPTPSRRVLLLRHGRTAWNAVGRFQGQLDPPLDEVGVAQADAVAVPLAGRRPVALLASDAQRALATAAPLAASTGLAVQPSPAWREIDLGAWQGLTRAEAAGRFPAEHDGWAAGGDVRRGGGETYAEVGGRASAALHLALAGCLADSAEGDGPLVVVTHGGTVRALLGTLLALPVEVWWRWAPLGNCRWAQLMETSRGWRLEEYGVGAPLG